MVTFSKMYILTNQIHSLARNKCGSYVRRSKCNILPFNKVTFTMIVWEKVVYFLLWCEPQIVAFCNYTFSWTTFFLLQENNVVHISDVVRPIFCLSNDTTFIKNTQAESGSIFCLLWTTYCRDFEEDFQLIFMNLIRLLIRNQCGSHIIHGIPNSLAFQQNCSRYDGPSKSGSFFALSKPSETLFVPFKDTMPLQGLINI